ncbi:hypothetical protein DMJ13_04755 [halophilic archaeon]|nr:hypothetical protein DMJ13_04755 [halophilic archaeon]
MPTYNIVEQGADETGDAAIDSVLDGLKTSDTTVVFPPGTYKLDELVVESEIADFKLIAPDGARLVPAQSEDNRRWIDVYSDGFVLDGFELDMRSTPIPPFVRMNSGSSNWELRRLITRGKVRGATDTNVGTNNPSDARTYFRLSAAAGTRGLLQDCYFHEGACEPTEASNRRAILVESGKGDLVFNRCWFELWAENTVYAKQPEGGMYIYNCFFRNTANGMRLGGNSEVRNCVSIKDDEHPRQAWSNGTLQRGTNAEAVTPTNTAAGINSYDGTLTIADSDFYHRYQASSCGGAITAPQPCEALDVRNVRISYTSRKNHDAIYTYNGNDLQYLQLEDVQVHNDHPTEYGVFIDQDPGSWGTVSGVIGGSGPQTNSAYVSSNMEINGNPQPPDTTPPLPSPPSLGEVPMQSAKLVRINNEGNGSAATYEITAGTGVYPAGNDGATVTMSWGSEGEPKRPPNSQEATGTIPPGDTYAFYVTGDLVSAEASGAATWTVDGTPYTPLPTLSTNTHSGQQDVRWRWNQVDSVAQPTRVVVAKPLSYSGVAPTHVRLRNVVDGGFEYRLEEWTYLDGSHVTETFHSLTMSPGERQVYLDDGTPFRAKAGTATLSTDFVAVPFESSFDGEVPVVLTKAQTFAGIDPIVTRPANVSRDSFDVRLQEEEALGPHGDETVGYVALEQTSGRLDGKPFEVRRSGQGVTDEWTPITFQQEYESPRFVADMQTFRGIDPANLRYRNLSGTGVELKVEEERSADDETAHVPEDIGYAVFEGSA